MGTRKRKARFTKVKKNAQTIHARKRAKQRYGINLNKDLRKIMVLAIQCQAPYNGYAELVEKQTNRVSVFKFRYGGKDLPVVYDRHRKSIVSILPQDYWESRKEDKC